MATTEAAELRPGSPRHHRRPLFSLGRLQSARARTGTAPQLATIHQRRHDNSTQHSCADRQRDAVIAQERAQRIQSTRALGVPVTDDALQRECVVEQDAEVLVLAHDGYNLPLDRASSVVRLKLLVQLLTSCVIGTDGHDAALGCSHEHPKRVRPVTDV